MITVWLLICPLSASRFSSSLFPSSPVPVLALRELCFVASTLLPLSVRSRRGASHSDVASALTLGLWFLSWRSRSCVLWLLHSCLSLCAQEGELPTLTLLQPWRWDSGSCHGAPGAVFCGFYTPASLCALKKGSFLLWRCFSPDAGTLVPVMALPELCFVVSTLLPLSVRSRMGASHSDVAPAPTLGLWALISLPLTLSASWSD